jgi:transcriptional regulator with XRE-family HTH domain
MMNTPAALRCQAFTPIFSEGENAYRFRVISDPKKTGKRLAEAIDRSGKTRAAVGAAAGVDAGTIQRWQAGTQEPGVFAFATAAEFIGTTPDALLGFDPVRSAALEAPAPPIQAVRAGLDFLELSALDRRAVMQIVKSLREGKGSPGESDSAPSRGTRRSSKARKAGA